MNRNCRILVVDDHRAIHEDFRKILAPPSQGSVELSAMEDELFGGGGGPSQTASYEITSAYQGQEALDLVKKAEAEGRPFAVAFVDVRMPPGWDGVETVGHLWNVSPKLYVVICTAYSDYSWGQIGKQLGESERLMLVRKPFDPMEVQQVANMLIEKWNRG
jgi:CheY-like chemotaxis protein